MTHLTIDDLSRRWQISRSRLEYMRRMKIGPAYIKIGKRVLYRVEDVENYESSNRKSA